MVSIKLAGCVNEPMTNFLLDLCLLFWNLSTSLRLISKSRCCVSLFLLGAVAVAVVEVVRWVNWLNLTGDCSCFTAKSVYRQTRHVRFRC